MSVGQRRLGLPGTANLWEQLAPSAFSGPCSRNECCRIYYQCCHSCFSVEKTSRIGFKGI